MIIISSSSVQRRTLAYYSFLLSSGISVIIKNMFFSEKREILDHWFSLRANPLVVILNIIIIRRLMPSMSSNQTFLRKYGTFGLTKTMLFFWIKRDHFVIRWAKEVISHILTFLAAHYHRRTLATEDTWALLEKGVYKLRFWTAWEIPSK